MNYVKNSNGKLLDLIFTNEIENVCISCCPPLVSNEKHHEPVSISISNFKVDRLKVKSSKILNLKTTNF